MRRLVTLGLALVALTLAAQPVSGQAWRTTMRYNGSDSTIFVVPGATSANLSLEVFSAVYLGSRIPGGNGTNVYTTTRDTSLAGWGLAIRVKQTDLQTASSGDSNYAIFLPKPMLAWATATRSDTLSFAPGSSQRVWASDTVSTTAPVPATGEYTVYFTQYQRNVVLPLNLFPSGAGGNLQVCVRPIGYNNTGDNYYVRMRLKGGR